MSRIQRQHHSAIDPGDENVRAPKGVQANDAIERNVLKRLRKLTQPYVLSVEAYPEKLPDVPQAIKALGRELRLHFASDGKLPRVFTLEQLHVEATAVAANGNGHFVAMLGYEHTFADEYIKHTAKRIRDAANQLSPD